MSWEDVDSVCVCVPVCVCVCKSCQIHAATEIGKRPLRKTLAVLTGQQRMAGPDSNHLLLMLALA